jgi:hypothetical protein
VCVCVCVLECFFVVVVFRTTRRRERKGVRKGVENRRPRKEKKRSKEEVEEEEEEERKKLAPSIPRSLSPAAFLQFPCLSPRQQVVRQRRCPLRSFQGHRSREMSFSLAMHFERGAIRNLKRERERPKMKKNFQLFFLFCGF